MLFRISAVLALLWWARVRASSKLQAGALNGGHACPVESEPHTGPPYQSPMLARADLTFSSAFRMSGPRLGPRTRGPMTITEVRLKRTLYKPHRPIACLRAD